MIIMKLEAPQLVIININKVTTSLCLFDSIVTSGHYECTHTIIDGQLCHIESVTRTPHPAKQKLGLAAFMSYSTEYELIQLNMWI